MIIIFIKKEPKSGNAGWSFGGGGGGGGGGSYCRGTCTYGPGVSSWEAKYRR